MEFLFVCWGVCSLVTRHFQAIMLIDENSWHVYQMFSLVSSTLDLERKGVAHMYANVHSLSSSNKFYLLILEPIG